MPPEPPHDPPSSDDRPNPWGDASAEELVEAVTEAPAERTVLPSESDSAPAAEQFNCPNCGGSIEIKALRKTCTGPITLQPDTRLASDGWAMKGLPGAVCKPCESSRAWSVPVTLARNDFS